MAEAVFDRPPGELILTAEATVGQWECHQMPNGEAGVHNSAVSKATGEYPLYKTNAQWTIIKTTGIKILKGCRVYWDHSANAATYRKVNDRDFYVGRAAADAESSTPFVVVDLNVDPPYDLDIARDPFVTVITGSSWITQIGARAKVGATAGFVVGAADNLPYVATLPASQTASTLVISIDGLRPGDIITGFRVVAQVESAGGAVTIDGDLRAVTNVAAEPTDASIGTMTQVSVTADTAVSQEKTGLTETVTSGKTYYLKITATTAAATDIILQACEITVTQAGTTNPTLTRFGGCHKIILTAVNEAQKVDMLSKDGFATGANAIIEAAIEVVSDGAGTVVDVSIGVANATHATNADSITDSIFCHLDANNTNINFESDDGTVEVNATDSTIDYTEGTRFLVWFDMRNPADVQIYVNAVLVLDATVFNVNASTATWKLLVHVEKTASTDTYEIDIDALRAWFAEQ